MLRMRVAWIVLGAALAVSIAGHAAAQEGSGPGSGVDSRESAQASEAEVRVWEAAKESALLGLERLQQDIRLLEAVYVLQARLLEWNVVLLESGSGLTSLEGSLCEAEEVAVWCGLLPATFGREAGDGDERG